MEHKAHFPINVSLEGRKVVVFGGGEVAERKVTLLLEFGAMVTVISPNTTSHIKELIQGKEVVWEKSEYQVGSIKDFFLVFAATDSHEVNHQICMEARQHKVWVNVADDPDNCDFILPASVRRGPLTIAISTGGVSPALARRIREKLDRDFGKQYQQTLDLLQSLRQKLLDDKKIPSEERGRRLLELTSADLPKLLCEGRDEVIEQKLKSLFGYTLDDLKENK